VLWESLTWKKYHYYQHYNTENADVVHTKRGFYSLHSCPIAAGSIFCVQNTAAYTVKFHFLTFIWSIQFNPWFSDFKISLKILYAFPIYHTFSEDNEFFSKIQTLIQAYNIALPAAYRYDIKILCMYLVCGYPFTVTMLMQTYCKFPVSSQQTVSSNVYTFWHWLCLQIQPDQWLKGPSSFYNKEKRQHDPLFTWNNATVTTNVEVALHKFTVWSVSHDTYA